MTDADETPIAFERRKRKPKMFKIQVINESTVIGPDAFATMVAACAAQLQEEVAQAHDLAPPTIEHVSSRGQLDPAAFKMHVVDDADSPGALGYHDVDEQGKPRGFVFAKTTIEAGEEVSVTLSHELIEMLLDRYCSTWVQAADGKMRAYEGCDAVEADRYPRKVGDDEVNVSNFLLPAYFAAQPVEGEQTDYLGKLGGKIAPAMTPGGYDIVVDTKGQPSQEFARHLAAMAPKLAERKRGTHSRTGRRLAQAARMAAAAG